MAGIGFKLRQILRDESYSNLLKGYVYAALVSTGPWVISIIGLATIGTLGIFLIRTLFGSVPEPLLANLALFRTLVVYTYAGTLILTGPIMMTTTRYVADRLFVNDTRALAPCYHWVATVVIVVGGLVAGAFHAFAGLELVAAVGAIVLFQAVALTWVGVIFLSAAKDYMAIVRAYALGFGCSVVLTIWGVIRQDLTAMIWGFALGQVIEAALMGIRIRLEFPSDRTVEALVSRHWRTLPYLAAIGLFYNIGIWADKVAFWAGPWGQQLRGWFYSAPHYETCIFLGYVTILPAMALFLIRIEAAFYKHYAAFYGAIRGGADLEAIRREKRAMVDAVRLSAGRLLKVQGFFTLGLILVAPWLMRSNPDLVPTFRVALLAAFAQVMLLILLIALLYFDWQQEVAALSVVFALSNVTLTVASFRLEEPLHGLGYLLACLVTLALGLVVFERRMTSLEYETFTKQPIRT